MTALCQRLAGAVLALSLLCVACRSRVAPTKNIWSETAFLERLDLAAKKLVELDVRGAREVLDSIPERRMDVELMRARLALAVGDCEGAVTLLLAYPGEPAAASAANQPAGPVGSGRATYPSELHAVANGCARAMAGASIVVDERRGVWVRFQNPHDRVLMPLIVEAADRAATVIASHLGTALPRPLRVELVADLPSLAAVTGLPLEAAETTGTIAIARWGRVTLVSPRATPDGYPWQDTLAHELTHLVVARQSDDSAPLWLQEGIAKREETRWRERMPLDDAEDSHREAKQALLEGRSIGVDRLGASIALLPTPQAAETAYAEVRDFLDYWVKNNGELALVLLLRDLAGLGSEAVDRAMISVSGYALKPWVTRWQQALLDEGRDAHGSQLASAVAEVQQHWDANASRRLRLAELLMGRTHAASAAEQLAHLTKLEKLPPELAVQLATAQLLLGRADAAKPFIATERVTQLDGTWLALRGRVLASTGEGIAGETAFFQSLAFAPTMDKVACRGFSKDEIAGASGPLAVAPQEPWTSLCSAATAHPSQ